MSQLAGGSPLLSFFTIYAEQRTLNFVDQEREEFPTIAGNLAGPLSFEKALPELFSNVQQEHSTTVPVSNINTALNTDGSRYGVETDGDDSGYGDDPYGGTGDLTISDIMAGEDLRGVKTLARLYAMETGTNIFTDDGIITKISNSINEAQIETLTRDIEQLTELVPKKTIFDSDLFPNADPTNVRDPDVPVVVVFGDMRKVDLHQVSFSGPGSQYHFGVVRKPTRGGTVGFNTLYRDGRVVSASEFSIVEQPTGYYLAQFAKDQRDFSGSLMRIQADLGSTEFNYPSDAVNFLLSDQTFALRGSVNAASFATAAAQYASLNYEIDGGLNERSPAGDVLNRLLMHGATLDKDSLGAYTIAVDSASLHYPGTPQLGLGDSNWDNILPGSYHEETRGIEERIRSLTLHGLFDPGFDGSGAYLLHASRNRDTTGVELDDSNPFLAKGTPLDRECAYRFNRMKYADKTVTLSAELEARDLALNQTVKLYIPNNSYNGDEFEIRRIAFETGRGDRGQVTDAHMAFTLYSYSDEAFTYTALPVESSPQANNVTDYSLTPPAKPTGLAIHSISGSTYTLKGTPPSVNVTHLLFGLYLQGSPQLPIQQVEIAVTPGVQAFAALVVPAGIAAYHFLCFARNKSNSIAYQDSISAEI